MMGTKEQIEALTNESRAKCTHLIVSANPRYWEDATINGLSDDDGTMVPLRRGDNWEPVIELSTGKVLGWPEGVTASIHYKVCDQGAYWLGSANRVPVYKYQSNYVPDEFLCVGDTGYGDYIILDIDRTGLIKGWKPPKIDWSEWELCS